MENQVKMNKTEKLIGTLNKALENNRGNSVRLLTRIISNAYNENPEKLRRFFNHENTYLAGISISAYHFLTGDINPIQSREYGGLGAIINDSEEGLKFNRKQLHFARLSGNALKYSKNSGDALRSSKNSGNALRSSKNSGNALWDSENSGHALMYSENSEDALRNSKNSGDALRNSKNSGDALRNSKNRMGALMYSKNSGDALICSENSGDALMYSKNSGAFKKR